MHSSSSYPFRAKWINILFRVSGSIRTISIKLAINQRVGNLVMKFAMKWLGTLFIYSIVGKRRYEWRMFAFGIRSIKLSTIYAPIE